MALNTRPIFTASPDIQGVSAIVTANTTADLTSGTIYLAFTCDVAVVTGTTVNTNALVTALSGSSLTDNDVGKAISGTGVPASATVQSVLGSTLSLSSAATASGTVSLTVTGTRGGFVHRIRLRPTPGNNTALTTCRVWFNNGGSTGTAANNFLFDEITLPLMTLSSTAAVNGFDVPINQAVPPGWRIYITLATGQGTGSWIATTYAGRY